MPERTGRTSVATANVRWTLRDLSAREALAQVIKHEPDLVGLQEWGFTRRSLLRETGPVRLLPGSLPLRGAAGHASYTWVAPILGGCPVGFRSDRYVLRSARQHVLSRPRRADPDGEGRRAWLRARIATAAVLLDLTTEQEVTVVDVHLTPGVQRGGRYREDRPVLVARHQQEVRRLARLVAGQLDHGRVVVVTGDLNFDGLRLPGLTSAWQGREDEPGTLGARRHVDDVHGPGPAEAVTLVVTDSDHRAMIARRLDAGPTRT